ncbi:apolipoprotein D-like [Penaeus chinensis]|uniref:apolipoprotein D-like n=1 Tax=Penaeus chinensis TaxID=139456 RepID=UPI001FB6729E|nr:apolipoprotein D-like [Penaeus chinensis]
MKSQVFVVVLAAMVVSSSAHSIGFGACPRLKGMKNFEPGKFAGFWYVIEMYSTFSRCLTLDFARISKDDFKVTEGKEYAVAQFVGIEHVFSNTGIYASRAPKEPAKFEVKWSNNVFGTADGTIINTDYEQYAVVLECQRVFYFMKRTSAAILSRSRKLDYEIIRKLKQDLCKTYNLNIQNFEAVSQERCATTPQDTAHQKRMSLMGGNARVSGIAQYPPTILSSPRNTTKPQPTKPVVQKSLQPTRPSGTKPQPTRPTPTKKPPPGKPTPAPKPHVLSNSSSTKPPALRPTPGKKPSPSGRGMPLRPSLRPRDLSR